MLELKIDYFHELPYILFYLQKLSSSVTKQ